MSSTPHPETSPPLAGRAAELDAVEQALDGLAAGRTVALVLAGEPGIGKSALLHEAAARAAERGMTIVAGRAEEPERDTPYALVGEALERVLESLDADDAEQLGPARADALASAFGTTSPAGPRESGAGDPPEVARHRLHGAVAALLERRAADAPLVLALDDLQWADDASLALVAYLLRRPPRGVMPLLAHRSGSVPDALVRALGRAGRGGEVRQLDLEPLDAKAATGLLAGIDATRRHELLRQSGGNPFYLRELASAARQGLALSPLLRATLTGELAALSRDARALAGAAAVIGDEFDPELAREVAPLEDPRAAAALDELLARELVYATPRADRFAFRRPVVAAVAYEWLGGAARLALHARAATALAARGAPPLARAPHVEQAARHGDLAAAELLSAAADAVVGRDPLLAARWRRTAVGLLPAASERRLPLLLATGVALLNAGRTGAVRGLLAEAQEALLGERRELRDALLAPLARALLLAGLPCDALRLVRTLHPAGEPEAAELRIVVAVALGYAGDWGSMAREAEIAGRAARLDDPLLRAEAGALLALAEHQRGDVGRAASALAEAGAAIADAGDELLAARPDALLYLVAANLAGERFEAALRTSRTLLDVARSSGKRLFASAALNAACVALLQLARLDEAEDAAKEALELADAEDDPRTRAWASVVRSWVAATRGDPALAATSDARAVEALTRIAPLRSTPLARCCLALARLEAGRLDDARELLLEAGEGEALERLVPAVRVRWAGALAGVELERGNVAAARAWSERASAMAATAVSAGAHGDAALARARVLLADGAPERAAREAQTAAEGFYAVGRRLDAAEAEAVAGDAHAAAGATADAVGCLRAAHELFAAVAARRRADAAAQALRGLGESVRRPAPRVRPLHGAAALSAREREIGELLAQGLTNRQLAEQLFISQKTVESHLTRLFAKLGVRTRTAAVRELRGSAEAESALAP